MPWDYKLTALVSLENPDQDVSSPSRFVQTVKEEVDGVEDAFRTVGRFDAVVFLRGHMDDALEVLGVDGVRDGRILAGPRSGPLPHEGEQ